MNSRARALAARAGPTGPACSKLGPSRVRARAMDRRRTAADRTWTAPVRVVNERADLVRMPPIRPRTWPVFATMTKMNFTRRVEPTNLFHEKIAGGSGNFWPAELRGSRLGATWHEPRCRSARAKTARNRPKR